MTERQTPNIDEVLSQLAEILRDASNPPVETQPPVPTEDADREDPIQVMKWREQLTTELAYWQMIPPLGSQTFAELDDFFEKLPGLLKSLPSKPHLVGRIDDAVTSLGGSQASTEDGRRSLESDPELEELAKRMAADIGGTTEERALPLLLMACCAALAGGATFGRQLRD